MSRKIIRATTVSQSLGFYQGLLKQMTESYDVVILSSPGVELHELEQSEGVRAIAVPMERHISIFKDLQSLFKLIRVFRNEKPDVVHSITPKAGLLCMMAAWCTRVPYRIHTFTGLVFPTSHGIQKEILKFTDRLTCACATHIIPEGEGVKKDLLNNGITRKKIDVLGYGNIKGVDLEYFSLRDEVVKEANSIKTQLGIEKTFNFIFVGRIVKDKGINELVEAFNKLYFEKNNVRLLLVGSFEDDLDRISDRAREAIKDNPAIISVGSQRNIPSWFAASNCLVFPSYREGFPNVVLEAGAMNLPAIVTDINGSNEIIENEYNGLIIPSHDEQLLYEAMKRVMIDDSLCQQLASSARENIASKYEKNFVQQCQLNFYKEMLGQKLNKYVGII